MVTENANTDWLNNSNLIEQNSRKRGEGPWTEENPLDGREREAREGMRSVLEENVLAQAKALVGTSSAVNSPSEPPVFIRNRNSIEDKSTDILANLLRSNSNVQAPAASTSATADKEPAHAERQLDLLLPRGSVINCTLQTAIDSTLPGLTTCLVSTDVYSADGEVVLLERGSQLVGETHADVKTGQSRLSVVWTDVRTPLGVRFRLDSPSTDALGRTGLAGTIDRHTSDRLGAAALITLLDTSAAAIEGHFQRGNGIVINPQTTTNVSSEILKDTLAQPPTIQIRPGAVITILAIKDIDFSKVYELQPRNTNAYSN